jgi:hypothetical protein
MTVIVGGENDAGNGETEESEPRAHKRNDWLRPPRVLMIGGMILVAVIGAVLVWWRAGLVTFINVLTASATLLNAQDQVAQSQQTLAQDLVSLYKALGGGWNAATSVASE